MLVVPVELVKLVVLLGNIQVNRLPPVALLLRLTMKKRTKKYNPNKRKHIVAKQLFKNAYVVFTTGEDTCFLVNKKTLKLLPVTDLEYQLINTIPYAWSMYLGALGKIVLPTHTDNYIKGECHVFNSPYYHRDLVDYLNETHIKILDRIPKNQRIGAGWIAHPYGEDISSETAFEVFKSINAFDREYDPELGLVRVI